MPRQSRRSAPAPRPAQQQKRQASTVPARQAPSAAPVQQQQQKAVGQPAQAQGQQPGLFAQMASTAAGVAVGSTIGHTLGAGISGMFGGGSQPAEQEQQSAQPQNGQAYPFQQTYDQQTSTSGSASCEADAKAFTRCLEQNGNNVNACSWYLESLKQCQAMASQY